MWIAIVSANSELAETNEQLAQTKEQLAETQAELSTAQAEIESLKTEKEKKYELIETIEVTEENTTSIERTTEPDGTEYNFEKILIKICIAASETTGTITTYIDTSGISIAAHNIKTTVSNVIEYGYIENGMFIGLDQCQ